MSAPPKPIQMAPGGGAAGCWATTKGGQMDWGPANGGGIFECCNCAPCCGCKCILCFLCLPNLSLARLFSFGTDQNCGIINHLLPIMCLGPAHSSCFIRHAVRTRMGVDAGGPCNGFCGDVLCAYFCLPCSRCQELRGAHTHVQSDAWDPIQACRSGNCSCCASGGCRSFRPLC